MNALRISWVRGCWVAVLAAFIAISSGLAVGEAMASSGVRLLMVEERGCRFCEKWHAEIGRGYGKSAEGRFAPLKRLRRGAADLKGLDPVVFTPTFIVVRSGKELGRVTGYPGADYFYSELRPILSAAGFFPGF